MDRIERAFENNYHCVSLIDIEIYERHNTSFQILVNGLTCKGVDPSTTRWVQNMLLSCRKSVLLHVDQLVASTVRGCVQGGVILPLPRTLQAG